MAYKYLNDDGLKALVKKIKVYIASLLPTKSVTYAELKALRDAGGLLVGRKYRITDYVTTTTQTDTRSAGHAFDIIVVADDESTLNENARAILHKGDTYFAGCKLGAWELKYCLDNDTTRFAWADTTNGKGVVWWMKDEWNNECYYDFKNIQYKRWKVTGATEEKYATQIEPFIFSDGQPYFYGILDVNNGSIYPQNAVIDENTFDWFYTFAARVNAEYFDASLKEYLNEEEKAKVQEYGADNNSKVYNCVIGKNTQWYYSDDYYSSDKIFLNNAVVYNEITISLNDASGVDDVSGGYVYDIRCGNDCSSWTCGNNCSSWTCGNGCYSWTCGNDCSSWTCGNDCSSWTCGNNCNSWTCGNYCYYWTCGNGCYSWTCGNYCNSWTCGNDSYSWTCGNSCSSWTCGNYCDSWTCGNNCSSWTCGNGCYSWTCGNDCSSWTCGNDCSSWTCGNSCSSWTCGNYCDSWTCGNSCSSWTCGNGCYSWTCGNGCYSWTCGNNCSYWTCGNGCYSWTCGNNCSYWTCGNGCYSWTCGNEVSNTKVLQDYVSYFHLDDGVSNITIKSSDTPTSSKPLKNFKVKVGIKGASNSNKLAIVIDATSFPLGSDYEWMIAKNSSGVVKQYCEADSIN